MTERLVRKFTGQPATQSKTTDEDLGDREQEVLQLIGQGLGTREMATSLQISIKTVEDHRENLKRKLGLGSSVELLHYAVLRFMSDTT